MVLSRFERHETERSLPTDQLTAKRGDVLDFLHGISRPPHLATGPLRRTLATTYNIILKAYAPAPRSAFRVYGVHNATCLEIHEDISSRICYRPRRQ